MGSFSVTTTYPAWFILLCALVAFGLSYVLYQKKVPWSKSLNYTLAFARFILIFIICLLLVEPLTVYLKSTYSYPKGAIIIDNSSSIQSEGSNITTDQIRQKAMTMKSEMEKAGLKVDVWSFDGKTDLRDSLSFTHENSDISALLKEVEANLQEDNLKEAVLITDGIYNLGVSPEYIQFTSPLSTVGLGDTTKKSDISIDHVFYNKVSYIGNKTPIQAEIRVSGFPGKDIPVILKKDGKEISRRIIKNTSSFTLEELDFLIDIEKKGIQRFELIAEPRKGEINQFNNSYKFFIEVLESKEKILIAALAPHPDIKAIKSVLEQTDNYAVEVKILSFVDQIEVAPYDLVVLHQIPNRRGIGNKFLEKVFEKNLSRLFILGSETDLNFYNKLSDHMRIKASPGDFDNVTAHVNSDFTQFKTRENTEKLLNNAPPIAVYFGDYKTRPDANILLTQQVGSVDTEKPLLVFSTKDNVRSGTLAGSGIWQWKLFEYTENGNSEITDDLISKSIQLLSKKTDKRKFKVYPSKKSFTENEVIPFNVELYNELYEPVYGQQIDLSITSGDTLQKKYSITSSQSNSIIKVPSQQEGNYKYKATTTYGGKTFTSAGSFIVQDINIEFYDLEARHDLLKRMAEKNGGTFAHFNDTGSLEDSLSSKVYKPTVHTIKTKKSAINQYWLLIAIALLACMEWALRKLKGSV